MSKFVIECPSCGNFIQAKSGIFAKRKINCTCGSTISVKTDKMTLRTCAHCGNSVVFDASKGDKAECPVCHNKINELADVSRLTPITCAQCGIHLNANKNAATFTCPVCDFVNDVQERIENARIKKEGLASIIKYEGDNDTLVWKHPIEDFNFGSQLIVHESQEAILFKDGQALDMFGPGRYTLETAQLPLLEKLYKLPTETEGTFHSEVYFINKTVQQAIKWGTPDKVRFIDPLTGVPLELGASGELSLQVENSRKLIVMLVGTTKGIAWNERDGFTKSVRESFRPLIINAVKTNLPAVISDNAIDLLDVDKNLDKISSSLISRILPGFEEYGLTIPQFYVTNIVLPENDPNFKRIKELHTITLQTRMLQAEAVVKSAEAQSEAQYRIAQEQSKSQIEGARREAVLQEQLTQTEVAKREAERTVIEAQAKAQAQRMEGLTEAEIMRAKGYNQKDVLQADVQKAYAAGLGEMGSNSSGGGSGSVMGDVLGLGLGFAAAGAVAPQLGNMMQGMYPQNMQNPQSQPFFGGTSSDMWSCACGNRSAVGNFCSNCGARRPAPAQPKTWDCTCGNKNIIGNFCNNCGKKKGE